MSSPNIMEPLVSIITTTYNHEKFIGDCIKSVLAQTYSNWEMIIIDDGSTDETPDIVKSLTHPKIKYIRQEHLGGYHLGKMYNKALEQSRGELIAILEGDDFWPTNKLEIQVPHFSDKKIILAYGDCIITNEYGKKLFRRNIPRDKNIAENNPVGSALKELTNARNFIYAQTAMVRKNALTKIGGFIQPDYLHLVDYPTWCRLALEGEFKALSNVLGYWRRSINSLTMSNPLVVSEPFIRYVKEFTHSHRRQIDNLSLYINIEELQKRHKEELEFAAKHQNYTKGMNALIYGYNKTAREYFKSYLGQADTKLFYKVVSVTGVILSYTPVLKIILPLFGIYFSKPLSALRKLLLSPRAKL